MNKLYESIKENLNEGTKYYYISGVEEHGPWNSESNTDIITILDELVRYYSESYALLKEVLADSDRNYREFQIGPDDVEYVRKLAEKAKELEDLNSEYMETFQ